MNHRRIYQISAEWDADANVWVVTSDDIPGLVTSAKDTDEVIQKLKIMVPELLELNSHLIHDGNAPEFNINIPIMLTDMDGCNHNNA